jgi:hypothetical protein
MDEANIFPADVNKFLNKELWILEKLVYGFDRAEDTIFVFISINAKIRLSRH